MGMGAIQTSHNPPPTHSSEKVHPQATRATNLRVLLHDMRMGTYTGLVKSFTCLDSPIMRPTKHAFDGGQSQVHTPYLLMICLLTGARGRPQTCTDLQL